MTTQLQLINIIIIVVVVVDVVIVVVVVVILHVATNVLSLLLYPSSVSFVIVHLSVWSAVFITRALYCEMRFSYEDRFLFMGV